MRRPWPRRGSPSARRIALLVALTLGATSCGSIVEATSEQTASPGTTTAWAASQERAATSEGSDGDAAVPLPTSPLAGLVTELPTALDIPVAAAGPVPTSMRFEAIGVSGAPITPVGVEANGEMEIPGADTIGWYSFGPRPGENGSAVLAAHIAYDNRRGAFRFLDDAAVGDTFQLAFDDGSSVSYQLVERAQYDKDALPFDRVFAKDGPPVITLISCGGSFQTSIASYEDNIVAYAIPVA